MWTHYCPIERDAISCEPGMPCNWCDTCPPERLSLDDADRDWHPSHDHHFAPRHEHAVHGH